MSGSPFVAPLELGISVTHLERMVSFYVDVLGCSEVNRAELPAERTAAIGLAESDVTIVWLQTATGERIKLLQPVMPPRPIDVDVASLTTMAGVAYLTFHVDDIVDRAESARVAGATNLLAEWVYVSGPGMAISFFRDPEGNVIELVQRAEIRAYRPDL